MDIVWTPVWPSSEWWTAFWAALWPNAGFWSAFWPNAAATIVGVGLGLPLALLVNRLAFNHAEKREQQNRSRRVVHAFDALQSALARNKPVLEEYAKVLLNHELYLLLPINVSAWEATSADFSAELTDAELRLRVAHHFGRLQQLLVLNEHLILHSFGTNGSMSNANQTRTLLARSLHQYCGATATEALALWEALQSAKSKLQGQTNQAKK